MLSGGSLGNHKGSAFYCALLRVVRVTKNTNMLPPVAVLTDVRIFCHTLVTFLRHILLMPTSIAIDLPSPFLV